jgi:hypothetical protein
MISNMANREIVCREVLRADLASTTNSEKALLARRQELRLQKTQKRHEMKALVGTVNQGLSRLGLGNRLDVAWDGDDLDKILTGESPHVRTPDGHLRVVAALIGWGKSLGCD